jgi:hypothetical protein
MAVFGSEQMAEQIVCVDNIGPREVSKRLNLGIAAAVIAVVGAAALLTLGVDRFWRGLIFVPAWISALGFLQARQRT